MMVSHWQSGHGMEWNVNFGMEYGRCQNGMEWKISRMEWKTIFHTSIPIPYYILCIVFTEKYIPMSGGDKKYCHRNIQLQYLRVLFVDKLRYLGRYIAKTVYLLHHRKYIAVCSIDVIVDDFDRFDFFFEIGYLPSPKFCFFTSSRKLVFVISFLFQLNFIYIFSFSAYNNSFWC